MKKFIISLMALIMTVSIFVGCESTENGSVDGITVEFEVKYGDEYIAEGSYEVTSDNVSDATEEILNNLGIEYKNSTFGDFTYISSINGIDEGSSGTYSGWCFTVNGETINVGAGLCGIEEGDSIEWFFVTGE